MNALVTDAIILHVADYLESSRILRLVTREAGALSVVARGARNSRKRFGSAVDLFAYGQATIAVRPGRDLHTLIGFDVTDASAGLATDLSRFSAASAVAECALRFVHDEAAPQVFAGLHEAFRTMGGTGADHVGAVAVGSLWRLVRDTGFSPALEECAACHAVIEPDVEVMFSHAMGGVLCARCAMSPLGGRRLPAAARRAVGAWMRDERVALSPQELRAHQRLLREFLGQYLTDGRPLRAFLAWEAGGLDN